MNDVPEMNDDVEKTSPRSAIILAVVIIVVAIYSTSYGLQTLQWIAARQWAAKSANPWLYDTPKPIAPNTDLPANTAPAAVTNSPGLEAKGKQKNAQPQSTELSEYGYQMAVPWTGKMKESPSAGGAEFKFDSGQVVVFGDPEAQLDTLHILRDTQGDQYAAYQPLFANGSISTNYALYKAVYESSPSQVSPVTNYAVAQRDRILLLMKLSFGFDLAKSVYSFDFGSNRGFQFGDPAKGPVAVRVFNSYDKQFRFIFTVYTGSNARIAQSDINQAMQTLASVIPASQ